MSKTKVPYYYQDYAAIASACGLKFSEEYGVISGTIDGYSMILYPKKDSRPLAFTAVLGVIAGPEAKELKDLSSKYKLIDKVSLNNHHLEISFKELKKDVGSAFFGILRTIIAELRVRGYSAGCEVCGNAVETKTYLQGEDSYKVMCDACADTARRNYAGEEAASSEKREHVILGLIGALIGAFIGGALVVLIGSAGYVAVIGGLVMGALTVTLYKKFSGKMTILSVIICSIVILAAIYFSNQGIWASILLDEGGGKESGYTFMECFQMVPYLVKEKVLSPSDYYDGLFKVFLYTAAGAAGTIVAAFKSYKLRNRFELLH